MMKKKQNKNWSVILASGVIGASIFISHPVFAASNDIVFAAGTYRVTTDYLNYRTGPGVTNSIMRVLSPNTTVEVILRSGKWVHIKTGDGKSGWVDGTYLRLPNSPASAPKPTQTVNNDQSVKNGMTNDYVNFRTGPSTSDGIITQLKPNTHLHLLGETGKWWHVQLDDGRMGYIYADYVNSGNRIVQYPSDPNFYEVDNGKLYHVMGTQNDRQSSYGLGPAPSFLHSGSIYVRDKDHQWYRRDAASDVYVGTYTPPYEGVDLRLKSSVTSSQINSFITSNKPDSLLAGQGQVFIDTQSKYGVSAQYLLAHAILESSWGTSQIAHDKNNFYGYMAYDSSPYASAAYFNSVSDAVEYEGYFVAKDYLNPNGQWYGGSSNLDGMNVHYATDPLWSEKVASIMSNISPYSSSQYSNEKPMYINAPAPVGPSSGQVTHEIPNGAKAKTLQSTVIYSSSNTNSRVIKTIPSGIQIAITGRVTDRWYQIQVGSQYGYIESDHIKLLNVLKVVNVTDGVNIRSNPSTSSVKMGIALLNTYLLAITDQSGNLVTSNGWYSVSYNGSKCYVYGEYVQKV